MSKLVSRIKRLSVALFVALFFPHIANAQIWHLDDEDSDDIYLIRPAVIDFYADWCGPCRALSPMMDRLAKEFSGKVDFYKVDADDSEWFEAVGEGAIPYILFLSGYDKNTSRPITYGTTGLPSYSELYNAVKKMVIEWDNKYVADITYNDICVDLGLSVKWAKCNLGARTPEQSGGYYAWGEVDVKPFYEDGTYLWYRGPFNDGGIKDDCNNYIKKYNNQPFSGNVDNKYRLDASDDAAHVHLGDGWHIPTTENWQELIEKCDWEQIFYNGVSGWEVTGPNGNSIFLPAAGAIVRLTRERLGDTCCYWSSDKDKNRSRDSEATMLYLSNRGGGLEEDGPRPYGLCIRPVYVK